MIAQGGTRIVVGVATSMCGLRALRAAVVAARVRGAPLHAVRAYRPSIFLEAIDERERAARDAIARTFAVAVGGQPDDVDLVPVVLPGRPDRVLTGYACRDTDLLVVGIDCGSRWRRLLPGRRCVARYCLVHSLCPIQVVPPDTFARTALRHGLNRRIDAALDALTRSGDGP